MVALEPETYTWTYLDMCPSKIYPSSPGDKESIICCKRASLSTPYLSLLSHANSVTKRNSSLETHIIGRISAFFVKGDNFCDLLFNFLDIKPILKGVYSKRKEFAPHGSKFFLFKVDPISEGRQNKFEKIGSLEKASNPLKLTVLSTIDKAISKDIFFFILALKYTFILYI